ncbi:MAG: radical SAM protein [Mycoplasmataceae bacterium]|jgi:oxygen-independent coproporphyrinogen-3 oxidase|nr:radical SAM protein [Mycoplasmataceae bacterium]
MSWRVKHLYIHIPFCKSVCTYCDFVRFVSDETNIKKYIDKIIKEIKTKCRPNQFETIYIGGGTPNYLNNKTLNHLLGNLNKYLQAKKYEFTIECNPEHLTYEQALVLKKNKINRVSLGVQTVNNNILIKYKRQHTFNNVKLAITNLHKANINNISCDLIYGFNELTNKDIKQAVQFIMNECIRHVSWYALELKNNSILNNQKYQLNDTLIEKQLAYVIKCMNDIKYQRYEVSSWSINKKYQSMHNKAYWLSNDWKAIGLGACGFENKVYYENIGNIKEWKPKKTIYTKQDYYFQIMLMGLRLKEGLNLNRKMHKDAYLFYKDKLEYVHITNNHLISDNLNLLDNTLQELI